MKTAIATVVTATLVLATLALAVTGGAAIARAQLSGMDASRMVNQMKTPAGRAADAYSRGARAKRNAEKETNPKKKQELYDRAKNELNKSLEFQPTFDAYLALGQIHLVLGDTRSAIAACSEARILKPTDEAAKSCLEAANTPPAAASPAAAATGTPAPARTPGSSTAASEPRSDAAPPPPPPAG